MYVRAQPKIHIKSISQPFIHVCLQNEKASLFLFRSFTFSPIHRNGVSRKWENVSHPHLQRYYSSRAYYSPWQAMNGKIEKCFILSQRACIILMQGEKAETAHSLQTCSCFVSEHCFHYLFNNRTCPSPTTQINATNSFMPRYIMAQSLKASIGH